MHKRGKYITAILMILLIGLLFFSKTIYSLHMPNVTAAMPTKGRLKKLESTFGTADWANQEEVYSRIGGRVEELLIREGDRIQKGQMLAKISLDTGEWNEKLAQLTTSQEKLRMEIESNGSKMEDIEEAIRRLEQETYEREEISAYELQLLQEKIKKAKEYYEQRKILYEAGAVSKIELEDADAKWKDLENQYVYGKEEVEKKEQKAQQELARKEKDRALQIHDWNREIVRLRQENEIKQLELRNIDLQEKRMKETLADTKKNMEIYAPDDGMVIALDVSKGQRIQEEQLVAIIGIGDRFVIECDIQQKNNFIEIGDLCKISNMNHRFTATVSKIITEANQKKVLLEVESSEISPGESFEVYFEKEGENSFTLVPNGAVNMDSEGYFLYLIKERDGFLGKEYYTEKLRIYTGDADDTYTSVTKGITFFEPIVLLSDKVFSEGMSVRIKNEGDLFVQ